ncbi:hypothetical protein ACFQ2M_19035 [Kitasatospora saccharophila]|uniref:hypothetical protein n=1 Tax=Kitasatospora saccharophila TaxID=407973 RepID=UPI00363CF57C
MASPHDHAPTGSGLDPAQMIAEARRAFFVMFGFLCLVWVTRWSTGCWTARWR